MMFDMFFRSTFIAEQNEIKHNFLVFTQNEKLITIEANGVLSLSQFEQVSVVITLSNGFWLNVIFYT